MIGEKISPILVNLEIALIEFEEHAVKPNYTREGFRAALHIFMSALMDKMFELQQEEKMPMEDALNMAESAGFELSKLIKVYTNIDTAEL